jgi:predicted HicB family RNase H-like nuclease
MDAIYSLPADDRIENTGTAVITVRLPRELHAALRDEAAANRTSLNRLCIAKLRGLAVL